MEGGVDRDLTVGRSLLIKAAMLAGTVAAVLWIGWPAGQEQPPGPEPKEPARAEVAVPTTVAVSAVPAPAREVAKAGSSKLDLNRASAADLEGLPGVGPVLARRVMDWRAAHGPFRSVEQLTEVKGIGPRKLERLRALVTVGRPGA